MPGITDIEGFEVGHAQNTGAATGLTVIMCRAGAVGGLSIRGGATSTRQTGSLTPGHSVDRVHAVVFTGGSAFGLDAAAGVMSYLEEQGVGLDVGVTKVPIVPTAALFDLRLGSPDVRPDGAMARLACQNASAEPVAEGSVGAGCGASVGKLFGLEQAMKSGLGTWSEQGPDGLVVAGLVAVNAFGDVCDPDTGLVLAGARQAADSMEPANMEKLMAGGVTNRIAFQNTTLSLVATNADLNRSGCLAVSSMAELGLSRVIRPYATNHDGDLVITLSHGRVEADIHTIGLLAGQVLQQAAIRAVKMADGLGLLPAWQDRPNT